MEDNTNINLIDKPKKIYIEGHEFTYKDQLINKNYSYRCKERKSCSLTITISENELLEYQKDKNYIIKYKISSTIKEHTCNIKDKNAIIEDNNKIKKFEDLNKQKNLIRALILNNIEKPLSVHIENLKINNISLSRNQVKWKLQQIREELFPNNNDFLKDISKIKITYENNHDLENVPLCYKNCNLINPEKKNHLEKYIIFSSKIQMNLIMKFTQIMIDGTFKSCPRGYYQILNIAGFMPELDSIIPIFMIPMTSKSFFMYDTILKDIIKILSDNGISLNTLPKNIIIDLEKSLQKAIKVNLPECKTDGCYFH